LNDVTHSELVMVLKQAAAVCEVIRSALNAGTLIPMETAQAGPCLDLRYAI
jgi:type II pantothenate kinase